MKRTFLLIVAVFFSVVAMAAKYSKTTHIQTGGKSREIFVYVPDCHTENRPLVISVHGMNQDIAYQKSMAQWEKVADTANFSVVYPQSDGTQWDISGMTDINFMLDIIKMMVDEYQIDETRVYITGFSMGGMLTYHIINKVADKFAAFGPISGYNLWGASYDCSRPVPICHVHGTSDSVVSYDGIESIIKGFANKDNCDPTPEVTQVNNICKKTHYKNGDCETEVILYSVQGRDHEPTNNGFHTTNALWSFFRNYTNGCGKASTTGVALSLSSNIGEAPATVTLTAKATLPEGASVKSIEFYQGNNLIETVTGEPYEVSVEGLEIGKYEFSAVMTDNQGKTYNSAKKSFEAKAPQAPYNGVASVLPGAVEMENYDEGGEGMAYHDSDDANEGKAYRKSEGVDLEEFEKGQFALGWTKQGEWVEYTLEVKYDDEYTWTAYVASGSDGSSFKLYIDDEAISEAIKVKNSGDWQTFREYTGKTGSLSKGKHILKVGIEADYVNIDKVEFKAVNEHVETGILAVENNANRDGEYEVYSLNGTLIDVINISGTSVEDALKAKSFAKGSYAIRKKGGTRSEMIILK